MDWNREFAGVAARFAEENQHEVDFSAVRQESRWQRVRQSNAASRERIPVKITGSRIFSPSCFLLSLVPCPPVPAFVAAIRLVLQPLADRHGGFLKRAETIVQLPEKPAGHGDRESHLGHELYPVHG